jgi:hypothetical protein
VAAREADHSTEWLYENTPPGRHRARRRPGPGKSVSTAVFAALCVGCGLGTGGLAALAVPGQGQGPAVAVVFLAVQGAVTVLGIVLGLRYRKRDGIPPGAALAAGAGWQAAPHD